MDVILWSLISLFVLVPIIFFLPFGLSFKGKLITITTSLIISFFAHLAISSFNFVIAGLMIVAIIFFGTTIVNQRLGSLVFSQNKVLEHDKRNSSNFESGEKYRESNPSSLSEEETTPNSPVMNEDDEIKIDMAILLNRQTTSEVPDDLINLQTEVFQTQNTSSDSQIHKHEIDWSLLEINDELTTETEREKVLV